VKEEIAAVERVCGRPIRAEFAVRRLGDLSNSDCDSSRACEPLGWQHQRSELQTQIADAWSWSKRISK
jgi:UDP-glucose 4-epimerase